MKKSTTWRVRALGRAWNHALKTRTMTARDMSWEIATPYDRPPPTEESIRNAFDFNEVTDFQIARLETIVSGPDILAARMPAGTFRGGDPSRPAGLRVVSYHNDEARYYRTIIDTREWITREWSDPASARRWYELSEKE
jgi:hypothetical protein